MQQGQYSNLFYFIHSSGEKLYPVTIKNKSTGQVAYIVSKGGKEGNKRENAIEVIDEAELITLVLQKGFAVRASTKSKARKGLYKPDQRSILRVVEQ